MSLGNTSSQLNGTTQRAHTSQPVPGIADAQDLSWQAARRRMEETLRANANRPLYTGTAVSYGFDKMHMRIDRSY